ncbi:Histone lysine demethylase PHF8 [Trichoplax sp. H2]|nr:Histone lysine demethylase PHF8 [Trichoplax sp. H2]|eukprot:RDD47211.1 Histone lysine demethylase PHF8 [Trichoplax sp. H2]
MRNLDEDINMKMREWTEYYNSSDRKRVLNVISLEFSDTRLSDLIEAPAIVRHIDLLKHVWPKFSSETGSPFRRPQVKKYCLMSVKASYTDFHIDFGGSSVWYHVLKGEKVFYLIEPTPENLITYEQWVSSKLQNEVFLGDEMQCYKCRIRQGETLFIPTGWIHAVYTPTDSLVFGGNFLHFLNMELQLKVYDLEIRLNTPEKFLFPFFETCIWYSGRYLVGLRGEKILVSPHLKEAAAAVLAYLRKWCLKENIKRHKRYIPTCINFKQLIIHLEEVVSEQLSTKIGSNSTEMKISDCVTKTCDTPGSEYSMQSKSYTCKKADLKGIGLKLSRKLLIAGNNQQSIVTESSVPPLTLSLKATPRIKEKKASLENDFTGTCQELSHSIADAKDCAGRNSRNSSINNHKRQNDDSDAHERESKRRVSDFKSNPEYKDKNDESCNMLDDTPSAHFRDNDSNVKSPDLLLLGVATSAIENEKSKTKRVNSKTTKQRLGKILKIDKTGRYLW